MSKTSRKIDGARMFFKNEALFQCPICHQAMRVHEMNRLVCSANHAFDLSRHGYVNLLRHGPRTFYHRDLFESRRQLTAAGLFRPLTATICEIIESVQSRSAHPIRVLDAGCGEGSLLASVCGRLGETLGVGLDISKQGVDLAAQAYPNQLWTVGDIANPPFADGRFDVVLNILSPSNYHEMKRVLRDDGRLIKVVPGEHYLRELRGLFYSGSSKAVYSNQSVVDLFLQNVEQMHATHVQYSFPLNPDMVSRLVNMTPLSWGKGEQTQRADWREIRECTVDLVVITGNIERCSISHSASAE